MLNRPIGFQQKKKTKSKGNTFNFLPFMQPMPSRCKLVRQQRIIVCKKKKRKFKENCFQRKCIGFSGFLFLCCASKSNLEQTKSKWQSRLKGKWLHHPQRNQRKPKMKLQPLGWKHLVRVCNNLAQWQQTKAAHSEPYKTWQCHYCCNFSLGPLAIQVVC